MRRQNKKTAALTWNDWTNNRCYLLEKTSRRIYTLRETTKKQEMF